MYSDSQISFSDYMLKKNFSSLIMRFERENVSIVQFGQNLKFDRKIEVIQNALKVYIEEMKPVQEVVI